MSKKNTLPRKVLYEDKDGMERIGLLVHIIEDAMFPFVVVTRSKWVVTVASVIERSGVTSKA